MVDPDQNPPQIPRIEQPVPLTPEQVDALVKGAVEKLDEARKQYARALQLARTDSQGQVAVAAFPMLLDVFNEKIRVDAIMLVLEQMGVHVGLPVTQVMGQLYEQHVQALGKVQIATGVRTALDGKKKGN